MILTMAMTLTVDQAAKELGISRGLAYELIAQGRLPHIRLGRRILIPLTALEEWLRASAA